jgi:hypothetical protein
MVGDHDPVLIKNEGLAPHHALQGGNYSHIRHLKLNHPSVLTGPVLIQCWPTVPSNHPDINDRVYLIV